MPNWYEIELSKIDKKILDSIQCFLDDNIYVTATTNGLDCKFLIVNRKNRLKVKVFFENKVDGYSAQLLAMETVNESKLNLFAQKCHAEVSRIAERGGEPALPAWDELPEETRETTRRGVILGLHNPSPEASHERWSKEKIDAGWVYGPITDKANKIHNCLVPYEQLPEFQQMKDRVFVELPTYFNKTFPLYETVTN